MSEDRLPEPAPRPWWVWLNVLGLDAVIAALVWMPLFARDIRARMASAEYVVLGCAVWCIYAIDRIMDGSMAGGPREERHGFAVRRRWLLGAGIVVATGVSAWLLVWRVQEIVSIWGLKLLGGIAFYFAVTWFSRRAWAGLVGAGSLGGIIAVGLMQGTATGLIWPQMWRGALAGFIVTVLYLSLRQTGVPAPWTLPRKLLGGWFFAIGTALAPHAHMEMWSELLFSNSILLFGAVCALNSLGIRLWEKSGRNFEISLLEKLYPWMILTVAAGAGMQWAIAPQWTRPLMMACAIAATLLLLVHLFRSRIPIHARRALADAAVISGALAMHAWIAFHA